MVVDAGRGGGVVEVAGPGAADTGAGAAAVVEVVDVVVLAGSDVVVVGAGAVVVVCIDWPAEAELEEAPRAVVEVVCHVPVL